MITSKPSPNLHALPSPINMTNMIRQHTEFPLLLDPPGKPDQQTIHCPTANFGPLSRGQSNVNHCVWYLFDPKVTRGLGLSQGPSNSECSALSYFYMSLAHKHINLKEPYNQDIKEQATTIFLKKEDRLYMKSQPQRYSVYKWFFKFNPVFVVLIFSSNMSITQARVNEDKTNLTWPLKPVNL